jgi:CRP/FNR family cyclic AMP-dependent transcriptional regulator
MIKMEDLEQILNQVELFQGLQIQDLEQIATIFEEKLFSRGDEIASQGTQGDSLFIISDGFVEVAIDWNMGTPPPNSPRQVLINLGRGQIIGEMSLVDQGPQSATVTALSNPTIVQEVNQAVFNSFCEQNPNIGYVIMKNIAADLSFKLRKQNLAQG